MKKLYIFLLTGFIAISSLAEEIVNPIITAMPSLSITPDARAMSMGGIGVATSADLNAQYHNPAKYVFMDSRGGFSYNAVVRTTQWASDYLRMYNHSGYFKIKDKHAISASFNYFSLGKVDLTYLDGSFLAGANPNEWALDVAYSIKLHKYVSMAAALRFMYSDLNNGANSSMTTSLEMHPGWTLAGDLSIYYNQPFMTGIGNSHLMAGLNIRNLGGKISYDNVTQSFIPASLNLGVGYEFNFCKLHHITISSQMSKLLVPTRDSRFGVYTDGTPITGHALTNWYNHLSSAQGWFISFVDAPDGFREEMHEILWSFGIEYTNSIASARFGYTYENERKGNRHLLTCGIGVNLPILSLDFAYVNSLSLAPNNPFNCTFVITTGVNLGTIGKIIDHKMNAFFYSPIFGMQQDL